MTRSALFVVFGLAIFAAGPARADADALVHEVQKGQTLAMIAKRYNVAVEAIQHANRIRKRNQITPGLRLVIPASADRKGTAARRLRDSGFATPAAQRARAEHARKQRDEPASEPRGSRAVTRGPSQPARPTGPAAPARGHRRGWVRLSGPLGVWQGFALGKTGAVTDAARRGFQAVLTSRRTGERHGIDPRLIALVARVSDHFGGATIHVVSGYRPKAVNRWTPHSRHAEGKAIDFRVDGVPNRRVRDFIRGLGDVGVGYYPNSSFVHLDVRDTPTYWVDHSGPGEAPRYATADGKDPGPKRAGDVPAAPGAPAETDDDHDEPGESSIPTTTPDDPDDASGGDGS